MTFSTSILALVVATTMTTVTTVFAEYICHTDANFHIDDMIEPTLGDKTFLGTAMVEAFQEAYKENDDINMDWEHFEDFDIGPDATALPNGLRGNNAEPILGYGGRYGGAGGWGCNMCDNDDDVVLGSSLSGGVVLTNALSHSKEHKMWEQLFCKKAQANSSFATMKDCSITLSDCHHENAVFDKPGKAATDDSPLTFASIMAKTKKALKESCGWK